MLHSVWVSVVAGRIEESDETKRYADRLAFDGLPDVDPEAREVRKDLLRWQPG